MKEAMKTLGQIVLLIAAAIVAGIAIGCILVCILNNLYYANTIY